MIAGLPFRDAVVEWFKIGWLSFGGPAGQIATMHRRLVDERKWIEEDRFLHALNYCMLLPGPEATQLAVYIGWLLHGWRGGLVAGTLFVVPGVLCLLALSVVYALCGQGDWVVGAFAGLKAAVVAIVLEAVIRIGRRALKGWGKAATAAAAFVAIFFYRVPFPLVVLGAGLIGFVASKRTASTVPIARPPIGRTLRVLAIGLAAWWAPVAAVALLLGRDHVLTHEGIFFSWTAVITFGGAYAVLAYVAQVVVHDFQWLRPGEMLDGLGMAETTPGPLIMVLQFVGFLAAYRDPAPFDPLVAGAVGSLLTTWVTFVPSFLFIFLGAPYVEALRGESGFAGAISWITAAVVGVILNLSVWFGIHAVFGRVGEARWLGANLLVPEWGTVDLVGVGIAAAAFAVLLRWKKALVPVVLGAASLGLLRHALAA